MVLAEELAEMRRREHAPGPVADMEDAGDPGITVLTQGNRTQEGEAGTGPTRGWFRNP